jgi:hypothetical protein
VTLRRSIFVALLALGLVVVVVLAWRSARTLRDGLPLRIVAKSQVEAQSLAGPAAIAIAGTGSMAPYIPAAASGLNARQTVCAYVVLVPNAPYTAITPGALCIYQPVWEKGHVMHQAAALDAGGWIMTGLHNERYENKDRVTALNFVGIVARTYVWSQ